MVSTLCQFASVCSSPTCNHSIVATVSGECSFLAHGETWLRTPIKKHRAHHPGQVPIITMDQPLYAIAMKV